MLENNLFHALVAAFLVHELDAMRRREWRIFPLLSLLPERTARPLFVWAHLPLVAVVLAYGYGFAPETFRAGFAVFAIVHVGLHWLFRLHPRNTFVGWGAWAPILVTGALGAAYLVAVRGWV